MNTSDIKDAAMLCGVIYAAMATIITFRIAMEGRGEPGHGIIWPIWIPILAWRAIRDLLPKPDTTRNPAAEDTYSAARLATVNPKLPLRTIVTLALAIAAADHLPQVVHTGHAIAVAVLDASVHLMQARGH